MLTLLDSQSQSIWVGLSLHICLKLNTALHLYHASWFLGTLLLIHYVYLSLSWLLPPQRLQTTLWQRPACRFLRTTATDLRQQRQIPLIARPTHHSYIRPISGDCWREQLCGGLPWWRNRFGPYVFCRIIPFICCRGYELLLLSKTNESRAVLCCLHYDLLHFWLLWEKDKT